MPDARHAAPPSRTQLVAAFAAVYLIWGSTYLAIRIAVETLPPFLLAGARFLIAGTVLYGWMRLRGAERPTRRHWLAALVVGALLLAGGNGMVVWAEQVLPSSVAALLISAVPIWMTLLDWLRPGGSRPTGATFVGLALGFVGVALLFGPDALSGKLGGASLFSMGVLLLAGISWAAGSLYSRGAPMPRVPLLGTGMEMIAGGVLLLVLGVVVGEPARLHPQAVALASVMALVYLIIFGSLVGFSAYIWLLRNTTTARASTYAYVNPVVAVFLGWAFLHESLSPRTLLAAAVIIGGVVVITTFRARESARTVSASPELAQPGAEIAEAGQGAA
jgi:drug/metabolite transporter (DMT)-like permease